MRLLQKKDTNRHPAAEDHCAHQVWKQEWKFVENRVAGKDARIADTRLGQSATQSWAQDGATIRISQMLVSPKGRKLTRGTKRTA